MASGPRPLARAGVVFLVALAAALAPLGAAPALAQIPDEGEGVRILGRADFDWPLETLDGRRFSLEEFRGQVVVINAWATWCPPCVSELASFQALQDSLADSGVRFLFVTDESAEQVRRFLRGRRLELPVARERRRMPAAFGLRGLPTTWVVDREGSIVLRRDGAAHWDTPEMERFLRYLARG